MAYGEIAHVGKMTAYRGTLSNQTVIQTRNNVIFLCSDLTGVTCPANGHLLDLPTAIPATSAVIHFPCCYLENGSYNVGTFYMNQNRRIYSRNALNNATVFFNGVNFNTNFDYYNDTLGNNDESNFTSPLSAS